MPGKSYGQYCGLARALDVVGNRWSLLIVRELLVGPARYSQLQAGLPGIASNLLADRLRELDEAGVLERRLDTHANAVAYALTPWGSELRGAVSELVTWSTPLMVSGPRDDAFRGHWLVVALEALMRGRRSPERVAVAIEVDDGIFEVALDESGVQVNPAPTYLPTTLRAEPMVILGLGSGMLSVEQAVAAGELDGDVRELAAVFAPS